jgi:hypothetical protein
MPDCSSENCSSIANWDNMEYCSMKRSGNNDDYCLGDHCDSSCIKYYCDACWATRYSKNEDGILIRLSDGAQLIDGGVFPPSDDDASDSEEDTASTNEAKEEVDDASDSEENTASTNEAKEEVDDASDSEENTASVNEEKEAVADGVPDSGKASQLCLEISALDAEIARLTRLRAEKQQEYASITSS